MRLERHLERKVKGYFATLIRKLELGLLLALLHACLLWVNRESQAKLKAWTSAFGSGICIQSSQIQTPEVHQEGQTGLQGEVESSYHRFDTKCLWNGLCCFTDYKRKNTVSVQPTACLVDNSTPSMLSLGCTDIGHY